MNDGERRAEARMARILGWVIGAHGVVAGFELALRWHAVRFPVIVATGPALVLGFCGWLVVPGVRSRLPRMRHRVDDALVMGMVVAGVLTEAVCQPVRMSISMESVGYTCLAAGSYAGPRTSRPVGVLALTTAAAGHAFIIRSHPAEAWQGAALNAAVWVGVQLVARELRRAGRDADDGRRLAVEAERMEAQARVHDAQGLLRVVHGAGAGDLVDAVEATRRRNTTWLSGAVGSRSVADAVDGVVAGVPDLDVTVDLADFRSGEQESDGALVAAVGRAVHTVLGNVREHAPHARVTISADRIADAWRLVIADDGPGFDPATTVRHHGLTRFTVDSLAPWGIRLDVDSKPGHGTTVSLIGGQSEVAEPGRFAAWRQRPTGGSARAGWIVDLARAMLLAALVASVIAGLGAAGTTSASPQTICAGIMCVLLVGHWWTTTQPATLPTAVICLSGVAVAGMASATAASDATTGPKMGVFLANWACMYLASVRPDKKRQIAPLALVQGVLLGRTDLSGSVITSLWALVGVMVTADLVRAWSEFGAQADAGRQRATRAERRTAAALLERQLEAMRLAGTPSAAEILTQISRDAAAYLDPPAGSSGSGEPEPALAVHLNHRLAPLASAHDGRVTVDVDALNIILPANLGRDVADAVRAVVVAVLATPGGSVDVRGAQTDDRWRVSLLTVGATPPALAAPAGCVWRTTRLPGDRLRLVVTPASGQA